MKKNITSFWRSGIRKAAAVLMVAFAIQGAQAQDVTLTALSGTTGAGSSEDYASLVDGRPSTKWCVTSFTGAYVVFKASEAVVPENYYLVTGGDTGQHPERNWKTWRIYGANFASDEEATRDAEGWTLIDQKVNADNMLPQANTEAADFTFSEKSTTSYAYFKIEVESVVDIVEKPTMQMAEFGFGTSGDITIISYNPLSAKQALDGNEGPHRLLDSNPNSKWGCGDENMPTWLIFKSSSAVLPTYYRLITGGDCASYTGRNWSDWEIYGGNFASDEEATRDAEGWVLLDKKAGIGTDVLPDRNTYSVYLTPSETITEAYKYFRLEVLETQNPSAFMQMSEFSWGNESTFKESVLEALSEYSAFNVNVTAQKSLLDAYASQLQELANCPDIFSLGGIVDSLTTLQTEINASVNSYSTYVSMVANVQKYLDEHPDMDAEGRALIESYLNTVIEPGVNTNFTNGSYLYIMENRQLNAEEVEAEGAFITSLMEHYAPDLMEGAIETEYVALDGTAGFSSSEDSGWMFDGSTDTKWCAMLGDGAYTIFKSSEPIQPTFYKLVTANDTEGNPNRNFRTWKIYAGNFDSEEAATRDAEGWVLIDEKSNIGQDQLPGANFATAYFYLSAAPAQTYQYFRLEVENLYSNGDRLQMSEFAFYNQANFYTMRNEYVLLYEDFDLNVCAQQSLIDEYSDAMRSLRSTTSVTQLSTIANRVAGLQSSIQKSVESYAQYEEAITLLTDAAGDMEGDIFNFVSAYLDTNEAPGEKFINGSYNYIIEKRLLDVDQLYRERQYVMQTIRAAQEGGLVALAGTPGFKNEEGPYGMFDGDVATKYGGSFPGDKSGVYVIFKAAQVVTPYFYALTTGGDTSKFPGRNWGNWKIYGANFNGDGAATRNADGWTLIDVKDSVGQNRLNPADNTTSYFGMSTGLVEYQYYKIEIECGYEGATAQHQMSEFRFGNEDEFHEILAGYMDQAEEFNLDVVAEQALIDNYEVVTDNLSQSEEMEDLFANYYAVQQLQEKITSSVAAYENYSATMSGISDFLANNPLADTEEKAKLETYLQAEAGSAEGVYPNGVYATIMEDHLLSEENLAKEIEYVEEMRRAAVAAGYLPGAEITSLMVNADLSQGWEGWNGQAYAYGNNGTMWAAENAGNKTFDLNQTLTGLKDGVYELDVNAGYRPYDNVTSTNYAAQIYANGTVNYVQNVIEDMMPVDEAQNLVNCYLEGNIPDRPVQDEMGDTIGYVLHGVQSCCYAFQVGRYQNKVLALVKDGQLTVGIKDLGTGQDADWTGFGNFRLYYAGSLDEAGNALDAVLESQGNRARTLLAYECQNGEEYRLYPNFGNDMREELNAILEAVSTTTDGAGKYELVQRFSAAFEEIYSAKKAYIDLADTNEKIYETWSIGTKVLTGDDQVAFQNYYSSVWDGFTAGDYSLQQAIDKKAELLATYPPYLYMKDDPTPNSIEVTETAPFTYHIVGNGSDAYMGLTGLIETLPNDDYVIAFEYKMDQVLEDGQMYFANPDLNGARNIRYGELKAASDWTRHYIDLRQAHSQWNWGNGTDHWLRWDMTEAESFTIDARHFRIITRAQMEAEGGSTAIEGVAADGKPAVQSAREGVYTISGQRVQKLTAKGLYIINGKKVLVK